MTKPNGFILYEGPSKIDDAPIVVIATGYAKGSANTKTGEMIQTWIMRSDVEPHTALKTGQDSSVCGDCKHRPANGGACYVLVHNAPLSVYRAYKRGNYAHISHSELETLNEGLAVRLGSYGDPTAAPVELWVAFTLRAKTYTGYTHQWSNEALMADRKWLWQELLMASTDSPTETGKAWDQDWRTFRVRTASNKFDKKDEVVCPASAEGRKRTTCAACGLCKGNASNSGKSIVIIAHGAKAGKFKIAA